MKKFILVSCISISLVYGQNMNLFNKFHDYFAKRDWKKLEKLLADDFQLIDWNHMVVDYKDAYMNYMKNWGGTMGTTWTVFTSFEENGKVYSTERDSDLFLNTFYEVVPTYSFIYEFKDNQIHRLSYDTLPGYHHHKDSFTWNYNNFILWVQKNQREEVPNMNSTDQKKSAQTYLKLIKLWKER